LFNRTGISGAFYFFSSFFINKFYGGLKINSLRASRFSSTGSAEDEFLSSTGSMICEKGFR